MILIPVVLIRKFLRSSKSRLVIGWPLTTAITRTLSAQTVFGTPVQKTDNVSIIIVKMIVQVLFKKLIIDILLVIIVRIFRITYLNLHCFAESEFIGTDQHPRPQY